MTNIARCLAVVCAALSAASCIHVNVGGGDDAAVPADRFHVLELAPAAATPAAPAAASRGVLAVRPAVVPDRFGKRVLRRAGPGRVTPLDHDFWADEPATAVTVALREALARTGRWDAVVDPSAALETEEVLDTQVLEFAVEDSEAPAPAGGRAVFRARFVWSESRSGRVVRSVVRAGSHPLTGAESGGLGAAMAAAIAAAVSPAD